jgi:hypothetical protein
MACYGANGLAVRRFYEEITADEAAKRSAEMPVNSPVTSRYMPGGSYPVSFGPPGPGRRRAYPKGLKDSPWHSWLEKPPRKRRKKPSSSSYLRG